MHKVQYTKVIYSPGFTIHLISFWIDLRHTLSVLLSHIVLIPRILLLSTTYPHTWSTPFRVFDADSLQDAFIYLSFVSWWIYGDDKNKASTIFGCTTCKNKKKDHSKLKRRCHTFALSSLCVSIRCTLTLSWLSVFPMCSKNHAQYTQHIDFSNEMQIRQRDKRIMRCFLYILSVLYTFHFIILYGVVCVSVPSVFLYRIRQSFPTLPLCILSI